MINAQNQRNKLLIIVRPMLKWTENMSYLNRTFLYERKMQIWDEKLLQIGWITYPSV